MEENPYKAPAQTCGPDHDPVAIPVATIVLTYFACITVVSVVAAVVIAS